VSDNLARQAKAFNWEIGGILEKTEPLRYIVAVGNVNFLPRRRQPPRGALTLSAYGA
jgi:hypothetical protein